MGDKVKAVYLVGTYKTHALHSLFLSADYFLTTQVNMYTVDQKIKKASSNISKISVIPSKTPIRAGLNSAINAN